MFALLLVLAYSSGRARHFDASALQGFVDIPSGRGDTLAERVAALGDPLPVALVALVLAGIALLRARPRIAVAVLLLVGATSVSSQLLKALLAYPREVGDWSGVAPEAFPSGHSTAAMTLAFCGVLVVPGRLRPLAAIVGLAFALGVAMSVMSLSWHFPSDVVGGYLLATGWTLAVVSGLLWLEQQRPEQRLGRVARAGRELVDRVAAVGLVTAVVAGAALATLAGAGVLVTRRPDLVDFAQTHTAAVVVGAAIVAAGAALLAVVTVVLRRGG
jgi:membrane-associated phospholipid phosphatase